MSLRDEILAADDLPTREVPVPEWGKTVYVKSLTGVERLELERQFHTLYKEGSESIAPCLLAATICDADGQVVFSYSDVQALEKKNGGAIARLFSVASTLNPMFGVDVDKISKNYVATR